MPFVHWIACLVLLSAVACRRPAEFAPPAVPVYGYRVVNSFPHDRGAFTQGLQFAGGFLYESTGLRGRSSLRQVDLESGVVLRQVDIPHPYFGEGIAIVDDRIYMLTWQERTGFIFDLSTFDLLDTFSYEGEGWGLAFDGNHLVMSDGTERLRFLDPGDLSPVRVLVVRCGGRPLRGINELAWIDNQIWANIFPTDKIARIDPRTGRVTAWIDLAGLLSPAEEKQVDVLNGIAHDPATGRLFITGKLWPRLFEIELVATGRTMDGNGGHGQP